MKEQEMYCNNLQRKRERGAGYGRGVGPFIVFKKKKKYEAHGLSGAPHVGEVQRCTVCNTLSEVN